MKKKTEYLTYIEDTRKQHDKIQDVATKASKKALRKARKEAVSVTYLVGEEIIKEEPTGEKEVVGTYENNRRKVTVGSKQDQNI